MIEQQNYQQDLSLFHRWNQSFAKQSRERSSTISKTTAGENNHELLHALPTTTTTTASSNSDNNYKQKRRVEITGPAAKYAVFTPSPTPKNVNNDDDDNRHHDEEATTSKKLQFAAKPDPTMDSSATTSSSVSHLLHNIISSLSATLVDTIQEDEQNQAALRHTRKSYKQCNRRANKNKNKDKNASDDNNNNNKNNKSGAKNDPHLPITEVLPHCSQRRFEALRDSILQMVCDILNGDSEKRLKKYSASRGEIALDQQQQQQQVPLFRFTPEVLLDQLCVFGAKNDDLGRRQKGTSQQKSSGAEFLLPPALCFLVLERALTFDSEVCSPTKTKISSNDILTVLNEIAVVSSAACSVPVREEQEEQKRQARQEQELLFERLRRQQRTLENFRLSDSTRSEFYQHQQHLYFLMLKREREMLHQMKVATAAGAAEAPTATATAPSIPNRSSKIITSRENNTNVDDDDENTAESNQNKNVVYPRKRAHLHSTPTNSSQSQNNHSDNKANSKNNNKIDDIVKGDSMYNFSAMEPVDSAAIFSLSARAIFAKSQKGRASTSHNDNSTTNNNHAINLGVVRSPVLDGAGQQGIPQQTHPQTNQQQRQEQQQKPQVSMLRSHSSSRNISRFANRNVSLRHFSVMSTTGSTNNQKNFSRDGVSQEKSSFVLPFSSSRNECGATTKMLRLKKVLTETGSFSTMMASLINGSTGTPLSSLLKQQQQQQQQQQPQFQVKVVGESVVQCSGEQNITTAPPTTIPPQTDMLKTNQSHNEKASGKNGGAGGGGGGGDDDEARSSPYQKRSIAAKTIAATAPTCLAQVIEAFQLEQIFLQSLHRSSHFAPDSHQQQQQQDFHLVRCASVDDEDGSSLFVDVFKDQSFLIPLTAAGKKEQQQQEYILASSTNLALLNSYLRLLQQQEQEDASASSPSPPLLKELLFSPFEKKWHPTIPLIPFTLLVLAAFCLRLPSETSLKRFPRILEKLLLVRFNEDGGDDDRSRDHQHRRSSPLSSTSATIPSESAAVTDARRSLFSSATERLWSSAEKMPTSHQVKLAERRTTKELRQLRKNNPILFDQLDTLESEGRSQNMKSNSNEYSDNTNKNQVSSSSNASISSTFDFTGRKLFGGASSIVAVDEVKTRRRRISGNYCDVQNEKGRNSNEQEQQQQNERQKQKMRRGTSPLTSTTPKNDNNGNNRNSQNGSALTTANDNLANEPQKKTVVLTQSADELTLKEKLTSVGTTEIGDEDTKTFANAPLCCTTTLEKKKKKASFNLQGVEAVRRKHAEGDGVEEERQPEGGDEHEWQRQLRSEIVVGDSRSAQRHERRFDVKFVLSACNSGGQHQNQNSFSKHGSRRLENYSLFEVMDREKSDFEMSTQRSRRKSRSREAKPSSSKTVCAQSRDEADDDSSHENNKTNISSNNFSNDHHDSILKNGVVAFGGVGVDGGSIHGAARHVSFSSSPSFANNNNNNSNNTAAGAGTSVVVVTVEEQEKPQSQRPTTNSSAAQISLFLQQYNQYKKIGETSTSSSSSPPLVEQKTKENDEKQNSSRSNSDNFSSLFQKRFRLLNLLTFGQVRISDASGLLVLDRNRRDSGEDYEKRSRRTENCSSFFSSSSSQLVFDTEFEHVWWRVLRRLQEEANVDVSDKHLLPLLSVETIREIDDQGKQHFCRRLNISFYSSSSSPSAALAAAASSETVGKKDNGHNVDFSINENNSHNRIIRAVTPIRTRSDGGGDGDGGGGAMLSSPSSVESATRIERYSLPPDSFQRPGASAVAGASLLNNNNNNNNHHANAISQRERSTPGGVYVTDRVHVTANCVVEEPTTTLESANMERGRNFAGNEQSVHVAKTAALIETGCCASCVIQ